MDRAESWNRSSFFSGAYEILLLNEPALRAGRVRFRFNLHDVIARPLRKRIDPVNERALVS